jgi:nucleotide-binding universal stress UspA family protein
MFPASLQHILVPVDFSAPSDRALDAAIVLARPAGARLTLLYTILPPYTFSEWTFDLGELMNAMERDGEAQLATRVTRAEKAGVSCGKFLRIGTPHLEILLFLDQQAPDLVVMSTHGRTGLRHVVMGSVAERVLQRSRRPVLVLPGHPDSLP